MSLAYICTLRKKSKHSLKVHPSRGMFKSSTLNSKTDNLGGQGLTIPRILGESFFCECRILLLLLSVEETDIYSVLKCGYGVIMVFNCTSGLSQVNRRFTNPEHKKKSNKCNTYNYVLIHDHMYPGMLFT